MMKLPKNLTLTLAFLLATAPLSLAEEFWKTEFDAFRQQLTTVLKEADNGAEDHKLQMYLRSLGQLERQLQEKSYYAAQEILNQLKTAEVNQKLDETLTALQLRVSSLIKREETAEINRLEKLFRELSASLPRVEDARDLDPWLHRLAAIREERQHRISPELQNMRSQIHSATQLVTRWQDHLHGLENHDFAASQAAVKSIIDLSNRFTYFPRSEALKLEKQLTAHEKRQTKAQDHSSPEALLSRYGERLATLEGCLKLHAEFRNMKPEELDRLGIRDFVQQLDSFTKSLSAAPSFHNMIRMKTSRKDPLFGPTSEKFLLDAIKTRIPEEEGKEATENETAEAYAARRLETFKKQQDWESLWGALKVMTEYHLGDMASHIYQSDQKAMEQFIKASNFEKQKSYPQAIALYRKVIGSIVKYTPIDIAGENLRNLIEKHPEAAKAADFDL